MKYVNADAVLPKALLEEIQRHLPGGLIYIPRPKDAHKKWGENSGGRQLIRERNNEIRQKFATGLTVDTLATQYCLSLESIKKLYIVKSEVKLKL